MNAVRGSPLASPAEAKSGRRRRIAARTRLDFWFDEALLLGYTLAYSYGFTGIGIHEWLGLGFGLALLFHLTLHWDWAPPPRPAPPPPAPLSPPPGRAVASGQPRCHAR